MGCEWSATRTGVTEAPDILISDNGYLSEGKGFGPYRLPASVDNVPVNAALISRPSCRPARTYRSWADSV